MPNGWDGLDPTQVDDGASTSLELATRYLANANITISAIRVWHGLNSFNVVGRTARIWSIAGSVLASVGIDASLPSGWSQYNLASPLNVGSGTSVDVSYSTTQYYGATAGGYPNNSADGLVTATAGRFVESHGLFPTTPTASFYGIDIVYTENVGGNEAPEVTGVSVSANELVVSASANIEDETPSTVTIRWDWGDGTSTTTGAGVTNANHTYATPGLYAVMATATDQDGLTDSYATPIRLTEEGETGPSESWLNPIFDAVVSDIQASGYFDRVNKYEPKRKPGRGLTAAIWVQRIDPLPEASGLSATAARIIFQLRGYSSMLKEPQDAIDINLVKAMSNIMRRFHGDFDFEGTIRNVDLLGHFGVALAVQSGYLEQDKVWFRTMDMFIPCIMNDVWPQVLSP